MPNTPSVARESRDHETQTSSRTPPTAGGNAKGGETDSEASQETKQRLDVERHKKSQCEKGRDMYSFSYQPKRPSLPPPRTTPPAGGNGKGGAKTSDMSQVEIDKQEKYRIKAERRKKSQHDKLSMSTSEIGGQKLGHISHQETDRKRRAKSNDKSRRGKESEDSRSDGRSVEFGEHSSSSLMQHDISHQPRKTKRDIVTDQQKILQKFTMHEDSCVENDDEMDEKDLRVKETIRLQKTSNCTSDRCNDKFEDHHSSSSSFKRHAISRRPHQTNHVVWDEKDLSIKERIPVERRLMPQGSVMANVASGVGDYAESGATTCRKSNDDDDELEKRRRRQQKSEEKDRRLKERFRRQKAVDAVKVPQLIDDDINDDFERRCHLRALERKSTRKKKGTRLKAANAKYSPDSSASAATDDNRSGGSFDGEYWEFEEDAPVKAASHHAGQKTKYEENDDESLARHRQWRTKRHPSSSKVDNNGKVGHSVTARNLIDMHLEQLRISKLNHYEEENGDDDFMLRRTSSQKIISWHQKYSLKTAFLLAQRTPAMDWVTSFYRCDPRWQILKFFNEVAREGGDAPMDENLATSPLANLFCKANVFTVWRPTSLEAIKNMMLGIATGKGLDIKGKSAKHGNISSYVPFIQIYEEPHKEQARTYIKEGKMIRVFYQSELARKEAHELLLDLKDYMLFAAKDAFVVLSDECATPSEQELAMKHLMYDDSKMDVEFVDTYVKTSHPVFGLDISECLFWESYVMMQDCSRPDRTEWDIGRKSELAFMDMNFKSLRHIPEPGEPRVVVYQMSKNSSMEPRMLLMAYEEYGRVKPVVSDFDCFLLGSRGVRYKNPIPKDQVELVRWSVANIGEVLHAREAFTLKKEGWMDAWFKVLKSAAMKGYYPKTPKYGNGDPKSYEIIEVAVSRLNETGCVRHGAECFNWFFPQVSYFSCHSFLL